MRRHAFRSSFGRYPPAVSDLSPNTMKAFSEAALFQEIPFKGRYLAIQ